MNFVYRLAEGVQVRKEAFGLLFYDYRGPRLYFVPTKDLISDTFFEGHQPLTDLLDDLSVKMPWPRETVRSHVTDVLEKLERKGLVRGKSIC